MPFQGETLAHEKEQPGTMGVAALSFRSAVGSAPGRAWERRSHPRERPEAEWAPPSWDEVVREHSARVYRLAYRLTGNQHDAEDLTQEVFVRVFRSLSNYTPGTFEGWLHRITTNLFLDMARRRQRIRFEGLADDAAERLQGREPTPAQAFDDTNFDADVQAALDALAPEYRAAVVLATSRPVLRGDLRDAGRQARHRAQPHPPGAGAAARRAGAPRADPASPGTRNEYQAAEARQAADDGEAAAPGGGLRAAGGAMPQPDGV